MEPFPPGFAVVDVETTGLSSETDRVVEIAVVRMDARGRVVSELSTLVCPGCDPGPTFIHGITACDLDGAPRFDEILGDVVRHLAGGVLVGHNVRFDARFLRAEFARARLVFPGAPEICTAKLAASALPRLPCRRLGACCRALGIAAGERHDALDDARAAAALFQRLRRLDGARGAHPWAGALMRAAMVRWPRIAAPVGARKFRARGGWCRDRSRWSPDSSSPPR